MVNEQFAQLWMKMTKDWKTHLEEALAPTLTEGQLNVLELLNQHQPMKPSDMLKFLETTPAAITTLIDRMEKGGLVKRKRDEYDRRIVWVTLTPLGDSELARGIALRDHYVSQTLENLSSRNQQLLVYLLGKVAG
jgi:DNA-binding MarR family transcriptional regulator